MEPIHCRALPDWRLWVCPGMVRRRSRPWVFDKSLSLSFKFGQLTAWKTGRTRGLDLRGQCCSRRNRDSGVSLARFSDRGLVSGGQSPWRPGIGSRMLHYRVHSLVVCTWDKRVQAWVSERVIRHNSAFWDTAYVFERIYVVNTT